MFQKKKSLVTLITFILMGIIIFFLFLQNKNLNRQSNFQVAQLAQQHAWMDSMSRSGVSALMGDAMVRIQNELDSQPDRKLSEVAIAKIAALSYSFKPYARFAGDTLSMQKFSPERGQLLLLLVGMQIDSGSLRKIMYRTSFAYADLRNADLRDADLKGVDLHGADLMDANCIGAKLNESKLSFANLGRAKLSKANLSGADMKRSDLTWAEMNEADLSRADLTEANITSAQMRNSDLRWAVFKWADLMGTFLNDSDMTGADLFRANLTKAQLEHVNLSQVNLTLAILTEANLTGADMTGVELGDAIINDPDWLTNLHQWPVTGAKNIQEGYKIADIVSYEGSRFQLKKLAK